MCLLTIYSPKKQIFLSRVCERVAKLLGRHSQSDLTFTVVYLRIIRDQRNDQYAKINSKRSQNPTVNLCELELSNTRVIRVFRFFTY